MVVYCHRCAGALEDEASFCPHCAAPQLQVAPPEDSVEPTPGPIHHLGVDRRAVDWRNVFRLALWIAIPVGILTIPPMLFPLILAGPVLVISLYQRRRPGTSLDGRSGFRIGALTGLLAAYVSAFGVAGWRLIERYSLHQGGLLDADYTQTMQQSTVAAQNMAQGTAAGMEQARAWLNFVLTPDGRAGMTLFSTAVAAAGTVLLAGLGGMLGARLANRRTPQ